jgi:hypothetical protein
MFYDITKLHSPFVMMTFTKIECMLTLRPCIFVLVMLEYNHGYLFFYNIRCILHGLVMYSFHYH